MSDSIGTVGSGEWGVESGVWGDRRRELGAGKDETWVEFGLLCLDVVLHQA